MRADGYIMNNRARTADRFARANRLPRSRLSIFCVMNVQSCHSYSGVLLVHVQKDERERKLHLSHARVAQVEDLFNMFGLSRRTDLYLIWCYQDSDTLVFALKQYCFHVPFTEHKPIIQWHVLSFLFCTWRIQWHDLQMPSLDSQFGSWISYRLRLYCNCCLLVMFSFVFTDLRLIQLTTNKRALSTTIPFTSILSD